MITPEQQIQRALRHVATRFPKDGEQILTDILVRVFPHSGEVRFYNDDDEELMRIVIEEWIHGSRDEGFYDKVTPIIRRAIQGIRQEVVDKYPLLRPYSFVLQDEDGETICDLLLIDDEETVLLDKELMSGMDEELDQFMNDLFRDEDR